MTAERLRPLVAFALVSLLCAVIVASNLAQGTRARASLSTEAAAPSPSTVLFGATLPGVTGDRPTIGDQGPSGTRQRDVLSAAVAHLGRPTVSTAVAYRAVRTQKDRAHKAPSSARVTQQRVHVRARAVVPVSWAPQRNGWRHRLKHAHRFVASHSLRGIAHERRGHHGHHHGR